MTILRFNEVAINQLSDRYKKDYSEKIGRAIVAYLKWMDENAQGYIFFQRLSHFCHGASGRKRVVKLRELMSNPNSTFFDIAQRVGEILRASGITNHSFKRYVYQEMTFNIVVDAKPKVSDNQFFNLAFKTQCEEFESKMLKHASYFSGYALTEGVRIYLKYEKTDSFEETLDSYNSLLPHPHSSDWS
jgi:hypothetical protein